MTEASAVPDFASEPALADAIADGIVDVGDRQLGLRTRRIGEKAALAHDLGLPAAVGIDGVAAPVNELVAAGIPPVAVAAAIDWPGDAVEEVRAGLAEGATSAGVPLLDVEAGTAPAARVVGTAAGLATDEQVLAGTATPGDVLIGIPGGGILGAALDRALEALDGEIALDDSLPNDDSTVGDALGKPARIYTYLLDTLDAYEVHAAVPLADRGMSALGDMGDLGYEITDPLPVPPVFETIRVASGRSQTALYRAVAMGTGMVLAVAEKDADAVCDETDGKNIGRVTDGDGVQVQGLTVAQD